MPIDISTFSAQEQATLVYVAYYDRAPDPAGLQFYGQLIAAGTITAAQAATDFSGAAETKLKYPYFDTPDVATASTFITSVYANLFGRAPDAAGLDFWTDVLVGGKVPVGEIILEIAAGAQGDDIAVVTNKIEVGLEWAKTAADAGVGTSINPIAAEVDGEFVVYDADAFSSATTVLDGVDATAASVVAAKATTASYFADAINEGETFNLTTGQDDIQIDTFGTVDTVRGIMNDDGTTDGDTFSSGDIIDGNGLTEVRITLVEGTTPDFVEMEGVNSLEFRGAGETSTVNVDASTYGSDINTITLTGADDTRVDVTNVSFDEGALTFELETGLEDGRLEVTGSSELFTTIDVSIDSASTGGGGRIVSDIGGAGLDISAEEDTDVDYDATMSLDATDEDASIAARSIGDVNLVAGKAADVEAYSNLSIEISGDGTGTIGDVAFGDINVRAGSDSASVSYSFDRYVDVAGDGDAGIGNLSVGNISAYADSGAYEAFVYLEADATVSGDGNASVGNTTIGNIDFYLGDEVQDYVTVSIDNYAQVDGEGTASVGDMLIGDVTFAVGDTADSTISFYVNQSAYNYGTGDATVGSMTIGNIDAVIGDKLDDYVSIDMYQYAYGEDGNASVGSMAVGDISVDIGKSGTFTFEMTNSAYAYGVGNDATVGDITLGNADLTVGSDSYVTIDVYAQASATGAGGVGKIGNVTIGSITSILDIDAELDITLDLYASGTGSNAAIGDVSIGDITVSGPVAIDASVTLDVTVSSDGTIGSFSVGDVDIDLLTDSSADYELYVTAGTDSNGEVGPVTLGDVDIVADTIYYEFTMYGDFSAGITVGDVTLDGDDINWQGQYIYAADNADIGNVTIGDITVTADVDISIAESIFISATDGDVGDVTIGDIMFDVAHSAAGFDTFEVYAYANGDLGNVTVGNVDVNLASYGTFNFSVDASGNDDTGNVTVGDITLAAGVDTDDATQDNARVYYDLEVDNNLSLLVGDISLSLSAAVSATSITTAFDVALASVSIDSDSSITVGDISMVANYDTAVVAHSNAATLMDFNVVLEAVNDDAITVGDITVVGGDVNDTGTALDNLGNLTGWIFADTTGTITVGDIDYSGYGADATIDVAGITGAANITAASGDTSITVNKTQNIVTLGDGDDTVAYEATETSGTELAELDQIINFDSGNDQIDLSSFGLSGVDVGGTVADYATFLTTAQNAMDTQNNDVFAMTVGSNVYVAINTDPADASQGIDFVIELSGITTVTTGDFTL